MKFIKETEYPRAEEIEDILIGMEVDRFMDHLAAKSPPTEFAYGCRHPDSEPGHWDRAFVVAKSGEDIVAADFDNTSVIRNPKTRRGSGTSIASHRTWR